MPRPVLTVVHGVRQRALSPSAGVQAKAAAVAALRGIPGGEAVLPAVLDTLDRNTTPSDAWDYHMASPAESAHVLDLIGEKAKRPFLSLKVWAHILRNLDKQTGLVLVSREALATHAGVPANHVSSVLSEFAAWNVLRRYKSGRAAVWQLNPHIATRLPAGAGEAARKAAGPVLRLVPREDGGRVDDARQPELV